MSDYVTDQETLKSFLKNENFAEVVLGEWYQKFPAAVFVTAHVDDPVQIIPGKQIENMPERWAIGIWAQVENLIDELPKNFECSYNGQKFYVRCEQVVKND